MLTSRSLLASFAYAALTVTACTGRGGGGSSTAGGDTAPTQTQILAACRSICEADVQCRPESYPNGQQACDTPSNDCTDPGRWAVSSNAYLNAVQAACGQTSPPCASERACIEAATASLPSYPEFELCVRERAQGCPDIGDRCDDIRTYTALYRSVAADCLALDSCEDINDCIDTIDG